jgi:hypothetical protein
LARAARVRSRSARARTHRCLHAGVTRPTIQCSLRVLCTGQPCPSRAGRKWISNLLILRLGSRGMVSLPSFTAPQLLHGCVGPCFAETTRYCRARAKHQWPQWRGPLGTGVAPHADPPVEWSETKNLRWKLALPGKGHSTPVVWADRVFVTTAAPVGKLFREVQRRPGRPR